MNTNLGPLVLALGLASLTFAGCHRHDRCDEPPSPEQMEARANERINDALDSVDATDSQRARVLALAGDLKPELMKMRGSRRAVRDTVRAELMSDKPDAQRLHALVDEQVTDMVQVAHLAIDKLGETAAVLDREQRRELAQRWEGRGHEFEGGWMMEAAAKHGLDKIDATDAQDELVLGKVDLLETQIEKAMVQKDDTRGVLVTEFGAERPNTMKMSASVDAMAAQIKALGHQVVDAVVEVHATLSPEQRAKVRAWADAHKCD